MTCRTRTLPLLFCALLFASPLRALAALDSAQVTELIKTSDVLPADCRDHISVERSGDRLSIDSYREPDASPLDCKIDAILLSDRIGRHDPSLHNIRVGFYGLGMSEKVWVVRLSMRDVTDYIQGKTTTDHVLTTVHFSKEPVSNLAGSYGALSYAQIVSKLGVVEGPARTGRLAVLIRLNSLERTGQDVSSFRKEFLHIEDLARRKENVPLSTALESLNGRITNVSPPRDRISSLNSLVSSPKKI